MAGTLTLKPDVFFLFDEGHVPWEGEENEDAEGVRAAPEGAAPSKSDEIYGALQAERARMLQAKVAYEDGYWRSPLSESETAHVKLFLMNAGSPDGRDRAPVKTKSVTAFVGVATRAVSAHIDEHNDPERAPARTRMNAPHWRLVLVLFLPLSGVSTPTRDMLIDYWSTAHGIEGKLRRGFEIATLFNLRHYVPPDVADFVRVHEAKVRTPDEPSPL